MKPKKSSLNKLAGQIGEQLVSAHLGYRGFYATPFSGNVPGFDIIATDAETLISKPIQVKTSRNLTGALIRSDIKKWVEINIKIGIQTLGKPIQIIHPDIIWIIVALGKNMEGNKFYICRHRDIQEIMIDEYRIFLERYSGIRPRNSKSTWCNLTEKHIARFENNWDLLYE